MARLSLARRAAVAGTLILAGSSLAACGSGAALGDAKKACAKINQSLATYKASTAPGLSQTEVDAMMAKAQSQLLAALPYAAEATSADGSFNSLMTSIQEADRVPEGLLVDSLRRQCTVVVSSTPYLGI